MYVCINTALDGKEKLCIRHANEICDSLLLTSKWRHRMLLLNRSPFILMTLRCWPISDFAFFSPKTFYVYLIVTALCHFNGVAYDVFSPRRDKSSPCAAAVSALPSFFCCLLLNPDLSQGRHSITTVLTTGFAVLVIPGAGGMRSTGPNPCSFLYLCSVSLSIVTTPNSAYHPCWPSIPLT